MSCEEKDGRVIDDGRAGLPSESLSYILARADSYDAIRADEKFAAWAGRVGGVDGVCLRGSWLHGLNHRDSDCDLLVVGASVDDKVRAVNVHAGGVDALCVTAGRFAHLLAQADQVCVEARTYGGALWRAVPRVAKARVTRAKNRKIGPQRPLRTPPARGSLKCPGRDRTKNAPTPKRKNHRIAKGVILPVCPARAQAQRLKARVLADQGACNNLGTVQAALKRGNVAYKCRLCSLI